MTNWEKRREVLGIANDDVPTTEWWSNKIMTTIVNHTKSITGTKHHSRVDNPILTL